MTLKIVFVVAAALLDSDNRVLLAQRPAGKSMAGLWNSLAASWRPMKRQKPR